MNYLCSNKGNGTIEFDENKGYYVLCIIIIIFFNKMGYGLLLRLWSRLQTLWAICISLVLEVFFPPRVFPWKCECCNRAASLLAVAALPGRPSLASASLLCVLPTVMGLGQGVLACLSALCSGPRTWAPVLWASTVQLLAEALLSVSHPNAPAWWRCPVYSLSGRPAEPCLEVSSVTISEEVRGAGGTGAKSGPCPPPPGQGWAAPGQEAVPLQMVLVLVFIAQWLHVAVPLVSREGRSWDFDENRLIFLSQRQGFVT